MIDEYCPECGHSNYDRHELEDGSAIVNCASCNYSEQIRPPNPDEVNV